MLPGVAFALLLTGREMSQIIFPLFLGIVSACLIASANYVLNEWVDAKFDRFHPLKKNRPAVINKLNPFGVYFMYIICAILGLILAAFISKYFFIFAVIFLIMGILYNVEPFRTKDKIYLDVISESVNNPIRLMLGWFVVTNDIIPPSSLLLGYWGAGAFLMGIKRYAEFRTIGNEKIAKLYRRSFQFYTEEKLLVMAFFYAMCSAFFLGVFLIKYRIELLFSLPLFAGLFTWYLYIGLQPNSNAQHPVRLYKKKTFMVYVIFLIIIVGGLLTFDLRWMDWFLNKAFIGTS
jgi:4-hydroxybenzoate polyprenyltransferase